MSDDQLDHFKKSQAASDQLLTSILEIQKLLTEILGDFQEMNLEMSKILEGELYEPRHTEGNAQATEKSL